jgi:hypothetical protein
LTFVDGAEYDGKPVKHGFMKWWVAPINTGTYRLEARLALGYEKNFYRDVVRPLLDNSISPNFVNYLSSSSDCPIQNIEDMLKGGRTTLEDDTIKSNMTRAIHFMTSSQSSVLNFDQTTLTPQDKDRNVERHPIRRPSTTGIGGPRWQTPMDVPSLWKISYLVKEAIPIGTITLGKWLILNYNDKIRMWGIMFQAFSAIYALNCANAVHNDCHTGNLWVEKLDTPVSVMYVYNNKCYSFLMTETVKMFDFDRSYSQSLGENPMLKKENCSEYMQCNVVSARNDIYRLVCNIVAVLSDPKIVSDTTTLILSEICHMLRSHDIKGRQIYEYFSELNFTCQASTSNKNNIGKFASIERIMRRCAKRALYDKQPVPGDISVSNVYVCNRSIFEQGKIVDSDLSRERSVGIKNCIEKEHVSDPYIHVPSVLHEEDHEEERDEGNTCVIC